MTMTHPDERNTAGAGVSFPADSSGRRSSTAVVRETFARAAEAVDGKLAWDIRSEPRWRESYVNHLCQLAEVSARDPQQALPSARAGLEAAHEAFRFIGEDGETTLAEAMTASSANPLHSARITGQAGATGNALHVPYRGRQLGGDALRAQLTDWEQRGIIEPSCAAAVRTVLREKNLQDLAGRQFVLLGANSEIGPAATLLQMGATVIAVDIDRPEVWLRLFDLARQSPGTLVFPTRELVREGASDQELAERAGANLVTETPRIRDWLSGFTGPLTIGTYAYLDGARHVQVAIAMDAIVADLARVRNDISYAVLLTPTDVYVIPEAVALASLQRSRVASFGGLFPAALRLTSGDRAFARNVRTMVDSSNGRRYGIVDCQLVQQGPNYALAKSIQRWRAMVLRAEGRRVSANVAAATRTRSVISNKLFAAAYRGCEVFGVEAFEPGANRNLMALALVHDILGSKTAANPDQELAHPLELFMDCANHGGFWRIAYQVRSAIAAAVVAGWGLGVWAPRHAADNASTSAPVPADHATA